MARNKYPEQTVQKILDVSLKLFAEKGYEKTTIQDIINELGMSKGAIYHHFKSKEDILNALTDHSYQQRESYVIDDPALNGLERIQLFMKREFSHSEKQKIDRIALSLVKIPKFTYTLVNNTMNVAAPVFETMIQEGVEDGSIDCPNPKMAAEVFSILANLWTNPILWQSTEEDFLNRIAYLGSIMDFLGVPILDEELTKSIQAYYRGTTA